MKYSIQKLAVGLVLVATMYAMYINFSIQTLSYTNELGTNIRGKYTIDPSSDTSAILLHVPHWSASSSMNLLVCDLDGRQPAVTTSLRTRQPIERAKDYANDETQCDFPFTKPTKRTIKRQQSSTSRILFVIPWAESIPVSTLQSIDEFIQLAILYSSIGHNVTIVGIETKFQECILNDSKHCTSFNLDTTRFSSIGIEYKIVLLKKDTIVSKQEIQQLTFLDTSGILLTQFIKDSIHPYDYLFAIPDGALVLPFIQQRTLGISSNLAQLLVVMIIPFSNKFLPSSPLSTESDKPWQTLNHTIVQEFEWDSITQSDLSIFSCDRMRDNIIAKMQTNDGQDSEDSIPAITSITSTIPTQEEMEKIILNGNEIMQKTHPTTTFSPNGQKFPISSISHDKNTFYFDPFDSKSVIAREITPKAAMETIIRQINTHPIPTESTSIKSFPKLSGAISHVILIQDASSAYNIGYLDFIDAIETLYRQKGTQLSMTTLILYDHTIETEPLDVPISQIQNHKIINDIEARGIQLKNGIHIYLVHSLQSFNHLLQQLYNQHTTHVEINQDTTKQDTTKQDTTTQDTTKQDTTTQDTIVQDTKDTTKQDTKQETNPNKETKQDSIRLPKQQHYMGVPLILIPAQSSITKETPKILSSILSCSIPVLLPDNCISVCFAGNEKVTSKATQKLNHIQTYHPTRENRLQPLIEKLRELATFKGTFSHTETNFLLPSLQKWIGLGVALSQWHTVFTAHSLSRYQTRTHFLGDETSLIRIYMGVLVSLNNDVGIDKTIQSITAQISELSYVQLEVVMYLESHDRSKTIMRLLYDKLEKYGYAQKYDTFIQTRSNTIIRISIQTLDNNQLSLIRKEGWISSLFTSKITPKGGIQDTKLTLHDVELATIAQSMRSDTGRDTKGNPKSRRHLQNRKNQPELSFNDELDLNKIFSSYILCLKSGDTFLRSNSLLQLLQANVAATPTALRLSNTHIPTLVPSDALIHHEMLTQQFLFHPTRLFAPAQVFQKIHVRLKDILTKTLENGGQNVNTQIINGFCCSLSEKLAEFILYTDKTTIMTWQDAPLKVDTNLAHRCDPFLAFAACQIWSASR